MGPDSAAPARALRRLAPGLAVPLVLLWGLASPARAGGGWVPERGRSYLEASLLHASSDETYDAQGVLIPYRRLADVDRPTTYEDDALAVFAEFGLGDGLAAEGDVLFRRVRVTEPATVFTTSGPADLRLLLKRGFRADALAWAISIETRMPLFYDETEYPALGSGFVDGAIQLHAGMGFTRGWGQAEIGLRARGGPAVSEWPYAVQVGGMLGDRWSVIADLRGNGLLARGGDAEVGEVGSEGSFDPARASSSVFQAGPGVAFLARPDLRLAVQGWHTFDGRNMPAGWKWKFAIARIR